MKVSIQESHVYDKNQFLTFYLNGQGYGLTISVVREIIPYMTITDVPQVPNFVQGVINLRGNIIPVIDLRLKLGVQANGADKDTCIIIVDSEVGSVGLVVDSVSSVIELSANQIDAPSSIVNDSSFSRFLLGMGKLADEVLILMDSNKLVCREELVGALGAAV